MSHCADCDPILIAGYVRCKRCGHTSYPTDAAEVGAFILATYPPPCGHTQGGTWLARPAAFRMSPDWCNASAASTGAPCRQRPAPGAWYCRWHDPDRRFSAHRAAGRCMTVLDAPHPVALCPRRALPGSQYCADHDPSRRAP